jgi:large subunit ribosomal protein L25
MGFLTAVPGRGLATVWSCIMEIEVHARTRKLQGTGASRRLRKAGKVPGVVYGGAEEATMIELDHNELFQVLRKEAVHASILSLNLDGKPQRVLLRTFNMHPFRKEVQHIDFQRVRTDQKIRMKIPLHFINQELADAVKTGGALVTHILTEIDIRCLPDKLPEFIDVDLSQIGINETVHANDVKLPEGVELALSGKENPAIASATVPRAVVEEEEVVAEEATPVAAVPAAKQPEKPVEAKKEEKKK